MTDQIQFAGEHLLIGNLGRFFVSLAFVSALIGGLFYLKKEEEGKHLFKSLGRASYILHAIAVLGIFITLFVIIQKHYFEYHYAWQHSSIELPLRYMVSCFWEGQEGSFLLWMVWNSLLGLILIFSSGTWERGVMPVMALAQVVLTSMLLGFEIGDIYTVGSSPFDLLRDKMAGAAPIFSRPDYLTFITDGNGLNPLLQNYWMVIHPPTLFLGFALTIVPFAFALSGLFRAEHRAWIKPALPWTLVAAMILGLGIIMGGFWAYESLSFGGYWAWDPVENASLVPWLLLIGGIHLMLIKKVTNTATIAAYLFVISSFVMVLYATFLTRSGVLGETSVHSFTDLGLAGQLMQFVVMFIWLPIIAVTRRIQWRWFIIIPVSILVILLPFFTKVSFYPLLILSIAGLLWFAFRLSKDLDNKSSEDSIWSREFWMFIGALILALSAIHIIVITSFPVINKVLGTNVAAASDVIDQYNRIQLPIAIIITLLTAIGQFFRYKNTSEKLQFAREVLTSLGIAILLTIGGIFLFGINQVLLIILLLSCSYALTANIYYIISHLKGNIRVSGASITHIGFAMMLIGVLVSSSKKQVITADFTGSLQNFDQQARRENMLLMKDEPSRLGEFWVTYQGDSVNGADIYFKVHYKSMSGNEEFTLYPNAQIGSNEGLMANPDTRHYLTYDVYTHITSIPKAPDSIAWRNSQEFEVKPGDSILTSNGIVYFHGVEQSGEDERLKNARLVKALIDIRQGPKVIQARPVYVLMEHTYFSIPDELPEAGLRFNFEIRPTETGSAAMLEIAESDPIPEYIVMKAIIFPYINLLWLGTIVMVIGFGIAALQRIRPQNAL